MTAVNRRRRGQAGRDGAAHRHRTSRARERPVLVFQRYGRGKAFAFTPQDSWLWQMHALDRRRGPDARELLAAAAALARRRRARSGRARADDRSRRARRSASRSRPNVVDPVVRRAERRVGDGDGHRPRRHHRRRADVVERRAARASTQATLPTKAPGWYKAKIEATRAGTERRQRRRARPRRAGDAEYFDATMQCRHAAAHRRGDRRPLLRRRRHRRTLADDLRYTGRGVTTVEEHELWHMPIVLLLLVGLLCAEWGYRRVVGLRVARARWRSLARAATACAVLSRRTSVRGGGRDAAASPPTTTRRAHYDGRFAFVRLRTADAAAASAASRRGRTTTRAPSGTSMKHPRAR